MEVYGTFTSQYLNSLKINDWQKRLIVIKTFTQRCCYRQQGVIVIKQSSYY